MEVYKPKSENARIKGDSEIIIMLQTGLFQFSNMESKTVLIFNS